MLHELDPTLMVSDELFAEAERQLNICNACRYCEGYCAVFPALERRTLLSEADMKHLANLCHDCRDCYYACPYAPPHPFGVNPPQILSEIRRRTYDEGLGVVGKYLPKRLRGWSGSVLAVILAVAVLVSVVGATVGIDSLWSSHLHPASPYSVVPYEAILVVALLPFFWSVLSMLFASLRYWRHTHGKLGDLFNLNALYRAICYAGGLRYLKGGGVGCSYPTDKMSSIRRRFHALTFYGFSALVVSTVSAGVSQDLLGSVPPYRLISVPVAFGVIGGMSLIIGCSGLIVLKIRADPAPSNARMVMSDYGLLLGLDALGITGLLTLLLRSTPAFGPVLVIHLAIVVVAFAIAPYTKFVHFVYRFLAIIKDNLEQEV